LLRNLKTSKYEAIELGDLIGAYSLVDEKISEKDLELALKIALTYTKHETGKSYELKFKNRIYKNLAFEDKKEISPFFIS
ncbi:ATP-binding protein, partial [Campylobacter sp. US18a]